MRTPIVIFLKQKCSVKRWSAVAVLAVAVTVELVDAVFGIKGLASSSDFAASNIVDVADVVVGGAAAWMLHG